MRSDVIRTIKENPNLDAGALSKLLNVPSNTIKTYRLRNKLRGNWTYTGIGIPFLRFDGLYRVMYKHEYVIACKNLTRAIDVLDHLIRCIETGVMSDKTRIEHPYFTGLKL